MRERIVGFSVRRPGITLAALALVTLALGLQLPKMKSDTDPKHMLPATSPVRVFGLFVAFGTLAILLMSFTLVPAVMALLSERKLGGLLEREERDHGPTLRWLESLGKVAIYQRRAVMVAGLLLVIAAVWGITRIRRDEA